MALPGLVRPDPNRKEPVSPALDAVCGALSLLVPLTLTAFRSASSPEWRDDMAVVTGLGFVPFGAEGAPSALLTQLLSLAPVGGRVLREGLVGAIGCGLSGAALYRIALSMLGAAARTPRLSPMLALTAALTGALSPVFQREAATAGGALIAVAIVLFEISRRLVPRVDSTPLREALVSGAIFGLLLAENRLSAGLLAGHFVVSTLLTGRAPSRKSVLAWAAGGAFVYLFWLVPLLVRPMAGQAWLDLGSGLSTKTNLFSNHVPDSPNAVLAWAKDMGPLALALGALGALWGVVSRSTRALVLPLSCFILASVLWVHEPSNPLAADPLSPLGLLATAALAAAAVLGVQTIVVVMNRLRVPFAEPAGVLLVVFHFTLVFVAAEQTSDVATDRTGLSTDIWTEEALSELPPNALVLVRSRALAFRLWAVRVTRGERPDVVMVPLGLLDRGSVARRLLEREPALGPLIRDVAMTGKTSEYSLSLLSDARPLFVELDPSWDKSLLSHLRPGPLWLGFVSHTLGRSDRTSALADSNGRRALTRVVGAAQEAPGGDLATLSILAAREREKAVLLAALGDKEGVLGTLSSLSRILPGDALVERLRGKGTTRLSDLRELIE